MQLNATILQAFYWVLLGLLIWVYTYIRSRLAGFSCLSVQLLRPFCGAISFLGYYVRKITLFFMVYRCFFWVVLQLSPPFLCNFMSFYDTLRPVRSKAAAPACSHILSHCRRQLWPPICYPSPCSILFYYGFYVGFCGFFVSCSAPGLFYGGRNCIK